MPADPQPFIVLVEDEEHLAKLITIHLEEAGMRVQAYFSAAPARHFLQRNFANLLLLDVNLPDQSGFELFEELQRAGRNFPAIFVTGNTHELSKIQGLQLGGDDYITKPFSYAELVARIHTVLRRAEGRGDLKVAENVRVADHSFAFCGARVVPRRMEVEFEDGQVERVGRKALGILSCLHDNRGTVVTRKALIHAVWGRHADVTSRSLDQYFVKVRELFRRHGLEMDCFSTLHGVGYLYNPTGAAPAAGGGIGALARGGDEFLK
jgi:DNA-binding response OmpR family regulator